MVRIGRRLQRTCYRSARYVLEILGITQNRFNSKVILFLMMTNAPRTGHKNEILVRWGWCWLFGLGGNTLCSWDCVPICFNLSVCVCVACVCCVGMKLLASTCSQSLSSFLRKVGASGGVISSDRIPSDKYSYLIYLHITYVLAKCGRCSRI